MSDDSPVEFRASGSKSSIATWVAVRSRHDVRIYRGASAILLVAGIFALGATYIFVFLVMMGMFCGVGRGVWLHLPTLAIVAGLFVLQRRLDGDDAEPIVVDAGPRGFLTLHLSRLTGSSWLMYLDKPALELNPVVRLATNLVLLAPRLFRLSWRMWKLSQRITTMDASAVGAGLDALLQSGGRIAIGELLQEFPNQDPQRFVGDLTTIDGVILLVSDPPGLTLSPAFAEDFEAWKRERRKRRAPKY